MRPRKNPPVAPETTPPEPTVAAVPQPQPTSPAVLKIQESIVALMSDRDQARSVISQLSAKVATAQANLHAATSRLQSGNGDLMRIDQEIQYRAAIIDRLEGRPQAQYLSGVGSVSDAAYQQKAAVYAAASGPNLVTMPQPDPYQDASDLVNRGHATRAI